MTLPETGWSRDQILSALTDMKSRDLATEGGGAFAYVYDSGEREAAALAAQAYMMFLGANGLDPTAFPSLLRMENEILGFAARHLGGGLRRRCGARTHRLRRCIQRNSTTYDSYKAQSEAAAAKP